MDLIPVHLQELSQPTNINDDEKSLHDGDLFEPHVERSRQPFLKAAVMVKGNAAAADKAKENTATADNAKEPQLRPQPKEEFPLVGSLDEFLVALDRVDKENAWLEKRQAKKLSKKKKSRRNNISKPLTQSFGAEHSLQLQEEKSNTSRSRAPLQAHN